MIDRCDVAVDGGQSGLRAALCRSGEILASVEVPGLDYGSGRPVDTVFAAFSSAWSALVAEFGANPPVDTVCLGLTTVLGSAAAQQDLGERVLGLVSGRRALVTEDMVTSHAGALDGGSGVVIAAGTGVVALGVSANGQVRKVDGGGYLYGDAGGGFWIGRRGLDHAVRGSDGREPAGPLTARATEVFGDLASLPERLYGAPDAVRRIAAFARDVVQLAESDPMAAQIRNDAAEELALTAAAACDAGTSNVSWCGGVLSDDGMRSEFLRCLHLRRPDVRAREPRGTSLTGAAWLATQPDVGIYGELVYSVCVPV